MKLELMFSLTVQPFLIILFLLHHSEAPSRGFLKIFYRLLVVSCLLKFNRVLFIATFDYIVFRNSTFSRFTLGTLLQAE